MRSYDDNSVDFVLCSHILEHVRDDRKAMREIFRILRSGGIAVVMVPIIRGVEETHEDPAIDTPELRWKYYGLDDHLRQYGKADFVDRLTAAGFEVDQLGIATFGDEAFTRAGIALDSVLYVAHKSAAN
jgi:SAM-dependent methyltransferase